MESSPTKECSGSNHVEGKSNEEPSHSYLYESVDESEDSVVFYYKMVQWLEAEIRQHTILINKDKYDSGLGCATADNELSYSVVELQKELKSLSTDQNLKKSVLNLLQLGQTSFDLICSANDENSETAKTQTAVFEVHERTTSATSDILRIQKEVEMQRSTLAHLKDETMVLKRENRELMYDLQEQRTSKETQRKNLCTEDEEINKLQMECNSLAAKIDLARFSFQGLILGSGINWAKDNDLHDVVLSLGQPIVELLKEQSTDSETT